MAKEVVVNGKTIKKTEMSDIPGLVEGLAAMRDDSALQNEVGRAIVDFGAPAPNNGKTAENAGEGGPAVAAPIIPEPSTQPKVNLTQEQPSAPAQPEGESQQPLLPNVDYSKQAAIDKGLGERLKVATKKAKEETLKELKPDLDLAAGIRKLFPSMTETEILNLMFEQNAEKAGFTQEQRDFLKQSAPPFNMAPQLPQEQGQPQPEQNSDAVNQAAIRIETEGAILAKLYPGFNTVQFLDANPSYVPQLISGDLSLTDLYKAALSSQVPAQQQPQPINQNNLTPNQQAQKKQYAVESTPPAGAQFGEPFGRGHLSDDEYYYVKGEMKKGNYMKLPNGRE